MLVVASFLIVVACLRRSWSLRQGLRVFACLAAGISVPALPYLVAIQRQSGSWTFSQKKSILDLLGIDVGLLDSAMPEGGLPWWLLFTLLLSLAVAVAISWKRLAKMPGVSAHGARVAAQLALALVVGTVVVAMLVKPTEVGVFAARFVSTLRPEILLLLVIGIGSRIRQPSQGRALFIVSFQCLYAVILFGLLVHYGYLSRRHMLPPLTLLFGYAGVGAVVLARAPRWLGERYGLRFPNAGSWPAVAPVLAVVLLIAAISLPKAWYDHRQEQMAGRLAAEWLRDEVAAAGWVAGNRSKLGYYSGMAWRPLYWQGELQSLARFDVAGVRFVIAEEDSLDRDLAPTGALVAKGRHRLEERKRVESGGRRAVVFEWMKR